jgi:hypothetical protein
LSIPSLFVSSTSSTFAATELVGGRETGDDVGESTSNTGFDVVGVAVDGFAVVGLTVKVVDGVAVVGLEVVGFSDGFAVVGFVDGCAVVGLLDVVVVGVEVTVGIFVGLLVGAAVGLPPMDDAWQLHFTSLAQLQMPSVSSKRVPAGQVMIPLSTPERQFRKARQPSRAYNPVAPEGQPAQVVVANTLVVGCTGLVDGAFVGAPVGVPICSEAVGLRVVGFRVVGVAGAGGVGEVPHPMAIFTSAQFQNCSGTPRPSEGIWPHAGS